MTQSRFVGTAGWSVERSLPDFPQEGSALERYSSVFSAVEINTSFYRRHRRDTWQRWHDAVPSDFRFAVKLSRSITHEHALVDADVEIGWFFDDLQTLGEKLGAILIQLPPKQAFEASFAEAFFAAMARHAKVPCFIEPRHVSWASSEASHLLADFSVRRVLADPQAPELASAAMLEGPKYIRLHGSPKIYYSAYADEALRAYADLLKAAAAPVWCIFDNTASGAALRDAVRLRQMIGAPE